MKKKEVDAGNPRRYARNIIEDMIPDGRTRTRTQKVDLDHKIGTGCEPLGPDPKDP